MPVREHSFVDFSQIGGGQGRSQNFGVLWYEAEAGETLEVGGALEQMVLLPETPAQVSFEGTAHEAPARTVVIVPPGKAAVVLPQGGLVIVLTAEPDSDALNAADYSAPDPRIAPVTDAYGPGTLRIIAVDKIVPPADKPRLKMIQTAVMSINWVEYDGPRDRTALSPHNHADLEQGSLAIYGDFVHHLRVPWTRDANDWRDDLHLEAGEKTLTVIPVEMIHTTEGVGPGKHLLIDIFAPARADFIAKGWMCNQADYT